LDDVAIIIVSTNEANWIRPCLRTLFENIGDVSADVVVVDNDSSDGTADVVAEEFPAARVVPSRNHGFSHANNRGLVTCDARYVLFLNPDTEVVQGTLEELVRAMDERPTVGLVGVRQISGQGELCPTIRRFPNALRAFGEAVAAQRFLGRRRALCEVETDLDVYDREVACDWTTGSFMLVRREAIESAGFLDERFFMYSDETDFCRRIKTAGWDIRHLPLMTIIHHYDRSSVKASSESLGAYNRVVYARKHFSPAHRMTYAAAVLMRHALRSVYAGAHPDSATRRDANRAAVRTLLGRAPVPHGPPSRFAVRTAAPEERQAVRVLER
jgi:N-acetylglucosaminyl-diphospho-decaprenol L-rhamnosyltransferase